jgi:hypothetical protein
MWMPMNTRPSVTIARYSPRSFTATGETRMPISAAPMPAPGSQIQIGRFQPHTLASSRPAEHRARVGADAHEEGVAERHLAGDAGQDVEAERGDGEDEHLVHRPQPLVVAEERRNGMPSPISGC